LKETLWRPLLARDSRWVPAMRTRASTIN